MYDNAEGYVYRPIYALPYWDAIGPFVKEAVAAVAEVSGRGPRMLFPAAVAHVLWCWQSRGTPLTNDRVFTRALVDEFVHLGMGGYLRGSKATHRAALLLFVETLNPAEAMRSRLPIPRSAPTAPYSQREVAALHSWARSQGTARRERDAVMLLALGLGAGLATRELLAVRTSDLEVRDERFSVMVWASRPRVVPIRLQWQRPLLRVQDDFEHGAFVFRSGRHNVHPGQVTDFLQRARTTLDVRPSRMRATWLLEHLNAGTPAAELLKISGLKNYAALDKIAVFRTGRGPAGQPSGLR